MAKKTTRKTAVRETAPTATKHDGCMCGSCGTNCAAWGIFILRLAVGGAFMWHGITKFLTLADTQAFFTQLFGAAGPYLAMLVAAVEILGGLALVLGIFTRWAAYALAVVLVVAIVWAKQFSWPMIELDVVLFASLLALAWNGPGRWALHNKCTGCSDHCC